MRAATHSQHIIRGLSQGNRFYGRLSSCNVVMRLENAFGLPCIGLHAPSLCIERVETNRTEGIAFEVAHRSLSRLGFN